MWWKQIVHLTLSGADDNFINIFSQIIVPAYFNIVPTKNDYLYTYRVGAKKKKKRINV